MIKNKIRNFRAYQSATQDDLWNALTEEAHRTGVLEQNTTVKQIMDTWTLQTGFPLITVTRNYDTNYVTVSQVVFSIIDILVEFPLPLTIEFE